MEHSFSRKEFSDLMWSKPIKDIAPEFGISDVALAKFCRKQDLPLPGRGYWARLKAGKPVEKSVLAPRGLGKHETICIGRDEWHGRKEQEARVMAEEIPPPPVFPESLDALKERVTLLVGKVPHVKGMERLHSAISALLGEDKKRIEKLNAATYHSSYDGPFFSSPYERRRLRLLNSIFLALVKCGVSVSTPAKNPSDFTVKIGDVGLTFRLDDPKRKQERSNWYSSGDARRPASDPLQLSISWHLKVVEGLRLVWTDSKEAPLEDALREIVICLIVAGEMQLRAMELQNHDCRVRRKADLIEAARKREEEARQKEIARLQRLEKARIDQLLEDAMSLRLANDLRVYIQAVQMANTDSAEPVPDDEMEQWVAWASAQIERIDPIRTRSFLAPVEDPGEEIKRGESPRAAASPSDLEMAKPAWHPNRWYTRLHR